MFIYIEIKRGSSKSNYKHFFNVCQLFIIFYKEFYTELNMFDKKIEFLYLTVVK